MHIVLKNNLCELANLADGIEQFASANGIPPATVMELNLALDELVTNSITHGFPDGADHRIDVELEREGSAVLITLSDDGVPFNPFEAPPPDITADLDDRPIGGLGVFLVRQVIDEVHYTFENGRNQVHLRKHLPAASGE